MYSVKQLWMFICHMQSLGKDKGSASSCNDKLGKSTSFINVTKVIENSKVSNAGTCKCMLTEWSALVLLVHTEFKNRKYNMLLFTVSAQGDIASSKSVIGNKEYNGVCDISESNNDSMHITGYFWNVIL